MNDYRFGNMILDLRTRSNMSQADLAGMLGVTNKAVSKWETGKAKPSVDIIRKLADLWHIPVEKLLSLKEDVRKQEITKIVITGGPCAGKTTALSRIQNDLTLKGYRLLFVPETFTEFI